MTWDEMAREMFDDVWIQAISKMTHRSTMTVLSWTGVEKQAPLDVSRKIRATYEIWLGDE